MAKTLVNGQWVDDGQPAAPGPVPPAAPATPGVPPLPTIFPPKPEHERTEMVEQRTASPESRAAAIQAVAATGAQLNANEQQQVVDTAEAAVTQQGAGAKETELERLKKEQAAIAAEEERHAKAAAADDATEVAEVAKKHITAGRARADFWKGDTSGEIFAAILRGVDRAASSFRGESGPTAVDRIIEAKMNDHERALVAEWESSKEAHELKQRDRNAYAAKLAHKRINAANQSALEVQLIGARVEKSLAALGPERAGAIRAAKDAAEMKAAALAEQKRAEGYDELRRLSEANRSPTAAGGAGKPLSAETRDLLVGAEQYAQLANRNLEIVTQNGGKIPFSGPLAVEFETNDKKMAAIQQKPLGKSDEDAKTARRLQGTPTLYDHIKGRIGVSDPVANYKKSLETNLRTITAEANKAAALESTPAATAAAAAPTAAPPAPAPAPVREYTEKGTGRKFKGRKLPDGSIEEIN